MKKFGKILLISLLVLVVILVVAISLTIGWRPFIGARARPLSSRKFESTPQRLERGRYVFNALAACSDCHSPHDVNQPGVPIIEGALGSGEVMPFDDLPGRVVAPNLTPDPQTGSGTWTDDQLARAIREGVGHDGRALFPMMPYGLYKDMSDEDLASVVVYIRSLPPVNHPLPATDIIFPGQYLIRTVPQPITAPVNAPDASDIVRRGHYLVQMAACGDCHTAQVQGHPVAGMDFAGGVYFSGAWGHASSANITPDNSGIIYYGDSLFVQTLRTGKVGPRQLSPIMPFALYKDMTDDDLKAIYAYLRTVSAVKHIVDNNEPPTYCKLCRQKHGGGDRN